VQRVVHGEDMDRHHKRTEDAVSILVEKLLPEAHAGGGEKLLNIFRKEGV